MITKEKDRAVLEQEIGFGWYSIDETELFLARSNRIGQSDRRKGETKRDEGFEVSYQVKRICRDVRTNERSIVNTHFSSTCHFLRWPALIRDDEHWQIEERN